MDKEKLKDVLAKCFDEAVSISTEHPFNQSNNLKSALFVSLVGHNIHDTFFRESGTDLNVITVKESGEKEPGEWLLDISITKDNNGIKEKILFAAESESNTSTNAFNEDFAKLIHIRSEYYLYLNGLDQKTFKGKDNYIKNRLEYAADILKRTDLNSFYIGFWASPKKQGNVDSIWNELQDGEYSHLKNIELYQYSDGKFEEV